MGLNLKDYNFKFDLEDEKMFEEFFAPYIANMEETQKEYEKITNHSFIEWFLGHLSRVDNKTRGLCIDIEDNYTEAHINYFKDKIEELLKDNELTESYYAPDGFDGDEYMFVEWLTALDFNGNKYIIEDVYGQGERLFNVMNPEKEPTENGYNGYKSIVNYLKIEDILEGGKLK